MILTILRQVSVCHSMSVKGNSQKSVGKVKILMEDSIVKERGSGRGSRGAGGGTGRRGRGRVDRSRSKQLDPSENCSVDVLESSISTTGSTKSRIDGTVVADESFHSIETASHRSDGGESQADDTKSCDTQEDGTQAGETRAGGNQDSRSS